MERTPRATAIIQEARICLLAGARIKDSGDPADALLVLLSGPLSELHGALFEPAKLSQLVKDQFGWVMSADAIEYFIPKMRQLGWLQSQSNLPSRGPFLVNLPEPEGVEEANVDTREALTELGAGFQSFARELSPFESLPKDPMEAGALLLRYVVDANLPIADQSDKAQSDETFLAARFIEFVNKNKLPAKEVVASLSAVGFLFRVAEEIGRPSSSRKVDLRIVVDGPILLDYLGCSGPLRADATADIFDRVRAMGASIVTFEHCVDEARDALRSVLKKSPRDRYGPTGEALRRGWVNENALLSLLAAFDVSVRAKIIEILPDDIEFIPQAHKYFDDQKAKMIEQIVNWHDEANENARFADSDTTVLTIRRRAGLRTSDLFTSRYVCITTNEVFAGAIRRNLIEMSYYNSKQIPPVITLKELAAKLWIELGNSDRASILSLPNSQLLLSCDRALRFNRKVVDKARAELAKVNPDQLAQFELLLEVPRSARAVMDITLNNDRYVSGDTVGQLVEAAVEAAGAEVSAKARAQRARDHERFKKELAENEKKLETEQQRADESERMVRELAERRASTDTSMLEAAGTYASGRFTKLRFWIRSASVFIAFAPLTAVAIAMYYREAGLPGLAIALVSCALGACAAMDRPGAWLSRLIQSNIEKSGERRLREMGRHDLAEHFQLTWKDGIATASADCT